MEPLEIERLPESTNESSSNGQTSKVMHKHKRRPETWKRNILLKVKRAQGKEYISESGKVIPAHKTELPCKCRRSDSPNLQRNKRPPSFKSWMSFLIKIYRMLPYNCASSPEATPKNFKLAGPCNDLCVPGESLSLFLFLVRSSWYTCYLITPLGYWVTL